MKVHYINILLFVHALNILANPTKKIHPSHQKIPTTRLLCECELYAPANYDNDPQMKEVMQQFEDHKLEKQMAEHFDTLQTDIQSDAIPTCICEKSIADKVEKGCLRCGYGLGTLAPNAGLLGGIGIHVLNAWKPAAIEAAKNAAISKATKVATQEGMNAVLSKIEGLSVIYKPNEGFVNLKSIVTKLTYNDGQALLQRAKEVIGDACWKEGGRRTGFCTATTQHGSGEYYLENIAELGRSTFEKTLPIQKEALETTNIAAVDAKYGVWQTANIAPIIAIVVIVLIMVIIYLILRYRRKKKMKKKLQYIKLLEE
nr:rifin PIR protein,putative [Plasmodium sp. DRC-Itaito]